MSSKSPLRNKFAVRMRRCGLAAFSDGLSFACFCQQRRLEIYCTLSSNNFIFDVWKCYMKESLVAKSAAECQKLCAETARILGAG